VAGWSETQRGGVGAAHAFITGPRWRRHDGPQFAG
jgi:hypothetical protein